MSGFQRMLLEELRPGVWYDVQPDQGTGGEPLPEWFHRQQTQPLATVRALVQARLLDYRRCEFGLIQVRLAAGRGGGG